MKILYLDCYSGISGDMFLGALMDAGLDTALLKKELSKLNLKGYRLKATKVRRAEISTTKFEVILDKKTPDKRRTLKDILLLIKRSRLDKETKDKTSQIFKSIARAEGEVHGKDLKDLHFHEVGDIDSIIDIVGGVAALKILKIEKVYSSRISIGGGTTIVTKGGLLPIPAPATLNLLKGKPVAYSNIKEELVTPTGAALLANLVDRFEDFPPMALEDVGYGAGARENIERPNSLRVMIGESKKQFLQDNIFVIEANMDDMNPIDYEFLMERLFEEGALDVYLTPVQMKKTRPGVLLTILAKKGDIDKLSRVVFNESTTIGVRYYEAERKKLSREFTRIRTKYGEIRLKVSSGPEGIRKIVPEYADCKRIADSKKISLTQVRKEIDKLIQRI